MADTADNERFKHIKDAIQKEWPPRIAGWQKLQYRNQITYWVLVGLTIGSGFAAGAVAFLPAEMKVWVFTPQALAGIFGLVAGLCRTLDAAADPGEKGRFYGVITTESEIALSLLETDASTVGEAQKLRDRLQEIQRKVAEGVPVGKGMQEISEMSKQLGKKQVEG